MDSILLTSTSILTPSQKTSLRIGQVLTVSDLLLGAPADIAKRCKITFREAQTIITNVCKTHARKPRCLAEGFAEAETFTTGDSSLDAALGGGFRTGLVWEVVGESAAGKTQFALQLSLAVQLSLEQGGLLGSVCYLPTSSELPTGRLTEMAQARPLFATCDLGNIQTIPTNNIPLLIHVLTTLVPKLVEEHSRPPARPVKLLVIDALAELFHLSDKTTTQTLVERSRKIYEISSLLHTLASQHHIAILVLNEVGDAFDRGHASNTTAELVYSHQSRFFNRGDSVPGEGVKEASLGLVWANQVNVRIMLTRTGRRRHLEDVRVVGNKVQKIVAQDFSSPTEGQNDVATLIRRLNIIFSAVAAPRSLDYIVTAEGVSILDDVSVSQETRRAHAQAAPALYPATVALDDLPSQPVLSQVAPLDVGSAEDVLDAETTEPLPVDEWDSYWDQEEMTEGVYNNADVDNLLTGSLA